MMVYVIDRRAPDAQPVGILGLDRSRRPSFEDGWRSVIERFPGHQTAQILFVSETEPFRDLAARIAGTVANPWSIYMIRIVCHGAPAYLQLGAGVERPQVRFFRNIRQSMTPAHLRGRGLEIHGCSVAGPPRGPAFVQSIANTIRLPVVSSPHIQYADNQFQFEGTDLLRVNPAGG